MAKLNETKITLKVSKLLRDNDPDEELLGADVIAQLEAIVVELAGSGVIVEIDKQ